MELGLIFFITSVVFFLVAFLFTAIFKVPDVHIGIPSSLFKGRVRLKKEEGYETGSPSNPSGIKYSIPIREPYGEGIHFKWPWWTVRKLPREILTKTINEREFPVGKGGTIIVSGVIQYRISAKAAYRWEEVNEKAIDAGLDAEIEQAIRWTLIDEDVDSAIIKTFEISNELERLLKSIDIRTREEKERTKELDIKSSKSGITSQEKIEYDRICKPRSRDLFGEPLTYAEQSYGIEVIKGKIDKVNPTEDLKKARDDKQREIYEKESQTTEMNHIRERMKEIKNDFPDLTDQEIAEFAQVWQKQATKNINQVNVSGTDTLTGILSMLVNKGASKND
jgi:regulator of protease activity HflC (stomatin/prohibitin superfamily)